MNIQIKLIYTSGLALIERLKVNSEIVIELYLKPAGANLFRGGKFKKIDRSVKTSWQEYGLVKRSWWYSSSDTFPRTMAFRTEPGRDLKQQYHWWGLDTNVLVFFYAMEITCSIVTRWVLILLHSILLHLYIFVFFLILQTSSSRPECIFKEISGTEHTSYQSMLNPDWYLALTKQGEAKPGPKTKRGQRAVSFMKESLL